MFVFEIYNFVSEAEVVHQEAEAQFENQDLVLVVRHQRIALALEAQFVKKNITLALPRHQVVIEVQFVNDDLTLVLHLHLLDIQDHVLNKLNIRKQ